MTKIETVTFSIKTSDGSFNTEVTIPLSAKPEVRDAAIEKWLKLAQIGLATGATEMDVAWPNWGDRPEGFDGPGGAE